MRETVGIDSGGVSSVAMRRSGSAGEESVRRANEQRFSERLGSQYEQYRQQRLANSESECRKMIADITTRLTQAGTPKSHPANSRTHHAPCHRGSSLR